MSLSARLTGCDLEPDDIEAVHVVHLIGGARSFAPVLFYFADVRLVAAFVERFAC
jgi:hypothetical protein